VNYICAQWDNNVNSNTVPWDNNKPVSEIILTQPQHFVRLLSSASSSNGAWIMRSEYVRGKTPAELADIFALPPPLPTEIVNVDLPASPDPIYGPYYVLWTGYAGPITGWGQGESIQTRLVADFGTNYYPNYLYTSSSTRNHRQPIGQFALSYRPLAGSGTTWQAANYLDSFIPQAYSDLENVYHNLDFINYIDFGSSPLQEALFQISPERFDAFSFMSFHDAVLFGDSILERQVFCHQKKYFCKHERKHNSIFAKCCAPKPYFGLEFLSEFDKFNNFHGQSAGLMGYFNFPVHKNLMLGFGIAGLDTSLHGIPRPDKAHGGNVKVGFYGSYSPQSFFIDYLISGGGNWSKFTRSLAFNGVDRKADSKPAGEDVAVQVQGGVNCSDLLTPMIRLSYFFNHQNHVRETGAHSLNLYVKESNMNLLRSDVGIRLSHVFHCSLANIMPRINALLGIDLYLNKRKIHANLPVIGGDFYALGEHTTKCYFSGGLGCTFLFSKCWTLFANYDVEFQFHLTTQLLRVGAESRF
jgi:hypothetical protein